ncbi:MAG: GNAT family N-acetyltransferase [Gemmobacter sp.]
MTPYQTYGPYPWGALLSLIRRAFAGKEGRIDPPSSMHALTADVIAEQAQTGEIWAIGGPPVACVFLTPQPGSLYLHKLAVDPAHHRQGHARALVATAAVRARAWGLPALTLSTRVELVENHAVFRAIGFTETARSAHAGFDRPTTIHFTLPIQVRA